ncbi:VCBS domain-containing protein, partial [Aeromonas taiwanensis]
DDTPLANNDTGGTVTEDGAGSLNGNVLDNDVSGADTPAVFVGWSAAGHDNSAAVSALGTYGTFTQNPTTGAWSYTLDNSKAATQALTAGSNLSYDVWYTMKDADGDESIAKLTINIKGADDSQSVTVVAAGGATTTVYETALADGRNELSDPALNSDTREAVSGTFTVSATDGVASITVLGQNFVPGGVLPQGINTGNGLLDITSVTLSADGKSATVGYTYTLSDNVLTPPAATDHFDDIGNFITVTGVSGVTSSAADLQIRIV